MTLLRAHFRERAMIVGVGRRVRRIRLAQGITQRELARRARLNNRFISAFELGQMNCSLVTLLRIADALCCPLVTLIPPPHIQGAIEDFESEDEPIAA